MATTMRFQVGLAYDSAFPRDVELINPCFTATGLLTDADQLCEDLADAIDTWLPFTAPELTVKSYDVHGTKPVRPNGSAIRNVGVHNVSNGPRELAICLSFYSGVNTPRHRGRLYVPAHWITGGSAAWSPRPAPADRDKVAELVPILAGLGGVDIDWVVYSKRDDASRKVSNWWVDDEWDVQRKRGMRPTTRVEGSTSG